MYEPIDVNEARSIPLRAKYKVGGFAPRHQYRARTGPTCCTINCPSNRKKAKKPARRVAK